MSARIPLAEYQALHPELYYKRKDGTMVRKNSTKTIHKRPYRQSYQRRPYRRSYRPTAVPRIRGRGGYYTDKLKSYAKSVQDFGKKWIPNGTLGVLGGALGGTGGALMGKGISKLIGFGDYSVKSNSLFKLDMGAQVPQFGNMTNGTIVCHREFITDIIEPANNGGAFTLRNFYINPGLAGTFPWLSNLAVNFDQYKPMGIIFHYKATSSPINNAVGAGIGLGTIIMATDYDSIDSNYTSKLQMENSQFCTVGRPSEDIIHPIECAPNSTSVSLQYVRYGPVPNGKDGRLYDLGNFQIATIGIPNNSSAQSIGELHCSYMFSLQKPQLNSGAVGDTVVEAHYILPFSTVSGAAYLGTTVNLAAQGGSNIPDGFVLGPVAAPSNYQFPLSIPLGSVWEVTYQVTGAATTLTNAMVLTLGSDFKFVPLYLNDTTGAIIQTAAVTLATVQFFKATFRVVAQTTLANRAINLNSGTLPGSITSADFQVRQCNTNLLT